MKKLSDYKDDEAFELWADLITPLTTIFKNENVKRAVESGKSQMEIAGVIVSGCKAEAKELLLRIDPTPIDGLNIVTRLITVLKEIGQNEDIKGFFASAEQDKTD